MIETEVGEFHLWKELRAQGNLAKYSLSNQSINSIHTWFLVIVLDVMGKYKDKLYLPPRHLKYMEEVSYVPKYSIILSKNCYKKCMKSTKEAVIPKVRKYGSKGSLEGLLFKLDL